MDVVIAPSSQIWDKGQTVIILFIVSAFVTYVTIHNQIAVLVGSFLVMIIAGYVMTVSKRLPYPSIKNQLYQLSKFVALTLGILLLTVFTQVFSLFVAVNGTLTIVTLHKLIVCIIIGITIYGILPKYLWFYYLLSDDLKEVESNPDKPQEKQQQTQS